MRFLPYNNQRGFSLVEALVGMFLVVLGGISIFAALTFANSNAAVARLYTQASLAAQNQIDLIQSQGPFIPQEQPPRIPNELQLTSGAGNTSLVTLYVDPANPVAPVSGTITKTITDISEPDNHTYAYRATVQVDYQFRGRPFNVMLSTIRGSDQ